MYVLFQVPGRLYPIELEYKPIKRDDSKAERLDPSPYLKIMQLIDHKVLQILEILLWLCELAIIHGYFSLGVSLI